MVKARRELVPSLNLRMETLRCLTRLMKSLTEKEIWGILRVIVRIMMGMLMIFKIKKIPLKPRNLLHRMLHKAKEARLRRMEIKR